MQSKALKASKRAPLSLSKREAQVRSELERFAPKFRGAVKAIALRHRWLGDLAVSFPALLFALAVRRRHVEVEAIMAGAQLGKPLNELAALARLPLWARKLPPEAFNGPIPDLPDGEILRRQIVNHIPRARKRMWDWVRIIAFASQWGSEGFAVWCARHAAANPREFKIDMLPGLALWSWVSQRPDAAAHKFIELRWEPSIGLTRAASACIRWLESVSTQLAIEAAAPRGWWFKPGEFDGLAFVPLDTAEKISAEAGVMKNCMLGYGPDIFEGYLQFWSVRREGSRVAVLSVERSPTSRVPHVGQLTGPENEDAGQQAWIATAKWIQRQDLTAHLMPARASEQGSIASTLWLETWRPYWQEKQKIPKWLPACFDSNWRWNMNDCGHVFEEEHRRLRRWRRGRRQN